MRPSHQAARTTQAAPAIMIGTISRNSSVISTCMALAARENGPAHGRMFITPMAISKTVAITCKRMPVSRYSGKKAAVAIM
ncbi:hypothetical protein D3C80_1686560 [compost metagenome]